MQVIIFILCLPWFMIAIIALKIANERQIFGTQGLSLHIKDQAHRRQHDSLFPLTKSLRERYEFAYSGLSGTLLRFCQALCNRSEATLFKLIKMFYTSDENYLYAIIVL